MSMTLGICEIYLKDVHGFTDVYIHDKLILSEKIDILEFYDNNEIQNELKLFYNEGYFTNFLNINNFNNNIIIRNFKKIITNPNYFNFDIVKSYYYKNYCCCIKYTFIIKIIQRSWKKIFKIRQNIIKQRMNINNLHFREINGHWPYHINYLPSIKGLLIK